MLRMIDGLLRSRTLQISLICAGLGLALWRLRGAGVAAFSDSWGPMAVALEFLQGPAPPQLYETIFFERGIKFQYPPTGLLYLAFLRTFGLNSIYELNLLNWLFLILNAVLCACLASKLFSDDRWGPYRVSLAIGMFVCALVYFPIRIGYRLGQIQILINLLFSISCLAFLSSKPFIGGAAMGIATTIKPQFGLLAVFALRQRQWHFVTGFLIIGAFLCAVSLALYGLPNHLSYFRVLQFLSERGEAFAWNNSVNGIFNRLLGNGSSEDSAAASGIVQSLFPPYDQRVYLATLASSLIFAATPFLLPKGDGDPLSRLLSYSVATVCFVMGTPVAWVHHYGVLLPIYLIALRSILETARQQSATGRMVLLAASFALTGYSYPGFRHTQGWLSLLQAPVFFGSLLLLGVLIVEFLGRRRQSRSQLFNRQR